MNYNEKAEEIFNSLTNRKKFVDKMPSNISQGESGEWQTGISSSLQMT